jgi:hypothetical protein
MDTVIRDPLYRDIIDGLERSLDPELFERCVADLLHRELPVAPIRGGSDAGMDGAVADGRGPAYPLITTTAKNVIGNLTRNLTSYVESGGMRRRVALATSRRLTQGRRRNLEERSSELGFELVQIYDQAAIADRLYANPEWCQELLSLTPEPPALSALPRTRRPLANSALIGRDDDLKWLRETNGDRLLAGQPGSGKTFLLYGLARDGWGLFAVSDDLGRIAGSLRREKPQVIMVDDAHTSVSLLDDLRHLRDQTGASFDIVATSWISDHDLVANALNLQSSQTRLVEPLTREEIVQVITASGLHGPNPLVREIVDQAEGRPGLAATLAHVCLRGGIRDVLLGEALQRSYRSFLQPLVGRNAIEALACIAVGGAAGMEMRTVADFLNESLAALRGTLAHLAAGGVIAEVVDGSGAGSYLTVVPEALREILVRDTFFGSGVPLPYEEVAALAPNKAAAAITLVGAKRRGAPVASNLLRHLVQDADSTRAWELYAYLGPEESRKTLEARPEQASTVAHPTLMHVPEAVIPLLLSEASGDDRPIHSTPGHPLRLIQDWLKQVMPGTGEGPRRRAVLVTQAKEWLSAGGNRSAADRAMCLAIWPGFEHHEVDPGMGLRISLSWGLLSAEELEAIGELWPTIQMHLSSEPGSIVWGPLLGAVSEWVYPGRHVPAGVPKNVRSVMRGVAERMLQDLAGIARDRPGLLRRFAEMASNAQLDLALHVDEEFMTLFPIENLADWRKEDAAQQAKVTELASRWKDQRLDSIVRRILEFELEARSAGITWPRLTPSLCNILAKYASSPLRWAELLLDGEGAPDLTFPFLQAGVASEEEGWQEALSRCLDQPACRAASVSLLLTLDSPPQTLLEKVGGMLGPFKELVHTHCLRGEIPMETLRWLLRSEDVAISTAAATGEWCSDPKVKFARTFSRSGRKR